MTRARVRAWFAARTPIFAGLGIAAVLIALFAGGRAHIARTAPYVQHIDERTLMRGARRVLQDDGLNPRIYNYPSLPFYLTAAGVAVGAVKASASGPEQIVMKKLGRLEPPFYDHKALGVGARELWLLLSLAGVAAAAGCAYGLAGPVPALLSAMVLGLVGTPSLLASAYVGVDIPLVLFCSLLFAQLACTFASTSYRDRVWLPALLCGAATACKYTGVVALAPALIALWLTRGPARIQRCVELLLLSALVFFVLCPRFLMDLPKFVDGITYESHHYGFKGHKRFTTAPGWDQLGAYAVDATNVFGWMLLAVAAVGFGELARRLPRLAVVMVSFPVLWLAMLCSAKVHFPRNLLPVLMWLGAFAGLGLCTLWNLAAIFGARLRGRRGVLVGQAAVVLLVAAVLPWPSFWERHHRDGDSRVSFARWAARELREEASIVIPSALAFAEETLRQNLHVTRVDLRDANAVTEAAQPGAYMLVPAWTTASGGVSARVKELDPGMNVLPKHRVIRELEGAPATPILESELSINPRMRLIQFE